MLEKGERERRGCRRGEEEKRKVDVRKSITGSITDRRCTIATIHRYYT